MNNEKWRPKNPKELGDFMGNFCQKCPENDKKMPCSILVKMRLFPLQSKNYPKQLTIQDGKPICADFEGLVNKSHITSVGDIEQLDLF